MALLLSRYPAMAGTASSLAGTLRFGLGSVVGFLVSLLPGDQSWPMLLTMAMCGLLSLSFYLIWGKKA
jgi:DHA1 family bicyclomycin/chloramphenicol resistance-like MFS transporter